MFLRIALSAAVVGLAAVAPARANVVYQFVETSGTGELTDPGTFGPRLVVTDAAFNSGSLTFQFINSDRSATFSCDVPGTVCTIGGNYAGFVSLTDHSSGLGSTVVDLVFNPNGTLSGSISDNGQAQNLEATGSGFFWSGSLHSDVFMSCGECSFSGYWAKVPEPASLTILGIGLAGIASTRGRRRAKGPVTQTLI